MSSDTPRTDEAEAAWDRDGGGAVQRLFSLARQLERELNALRATESSPGEADTTNHEQLYHTVMGLLRDTQMKHGLCRPRELKACTHCNAMDALSDMLNGYKGPKLVLAQFDRALPQESTVDAEHVDPRSNGTPVVVGEAEELRSRLAELSTKLHSICDQIGHPDYSLREMATDLRSIAARSQEGKQ